MLIQFVQATENRQNYYRFNLFLTFVGTRYGVILTHLMVRQITVINFLFNHFLRTVVFVTLLPQRYTQDLPPKLRHLSKHRVFNT